MKRLAATFIALLVFVGCEATAPSPHGRRMGSITGQPTVQWVSTLPTITGNNATIILFDTTAGSSSNRKNRVNVDRVMFSGRCDQAITLLYQVERTGSTTWRTLNGNGSGDTVAANTDTVYDYLVLGPDSRLEAVTGGTGPSTCEYDIGLFGDRTLGM